MSAVFGPAGNGDGFAPWGGKSVLDAPAYVRSLGLGAYEYQAGHGVTIGEERAALLGEKARAAGVRLSLHAPYYISLASREEQKRRNSADYILKSARAVRWMGGDRIVVHSGSCAGMPREEALALAEDTLRRALAALDAEGLGDVRPCVETMGKINQLGTLEEVIALCRLDERLLPCVDFGHLNARTGGGLSAPGAVEAVFAAVRDGLGEERTRAMHVHFSKIEYSAGGEKRHLTFADAVYGPEFEPVAEAAVQFGCSPVFICESAGTQDADAVKMKEIYQRKREGTE